MSGSTTDSLSARRRLPQWRARGPGASGALVGTSGRTPWSLDSDDRRGLFRGWLLVAGLIALAIVVNALSVQADNRHVAHWEPWVWEGTSNGMVLLFAWVPGLAVLMARPEIMRAGFSAWGRLVIVHTGAALLFSGLHVFGMLAARQAIYTAAGGSYDYGPLGERFVYEFRKDLLTYAICVALFWLARRKREAREAEPAPADFDILDGGRLIRTPIADIVAASSAGNYVEFLLADGRRPLMRTTLLAVQAELEPRGFLRTHRSWLVNPARLTGLIPQGSGDWTVELGGASAPLSRRYPEAQVRLRLGATTGPNKKADGAVTEAP
jgi:hypothetical protein